MKVLYCTHTSITVSETFLRKTLNFLVREFEVKIISTASKGNNNYPCEHYFLNIRTDGIAAGLLMLVNYLIYSKSKEHSAFDLHRKRITHFFKSHNIKADVALIEYGTSAYKFVEALNARKIPYIICFHGYDASAYLGYNWYLKQLTTIANGAIMNIVPSNHLRRRLELIGVRSDLINVEPYAPDYTNLPAPKENSTITIASLGRLTGKKLPQALIICAKLVIAKYPEVKFNLIGDGPLWDECKRLVEELNVGEQVKLLGSMEHEQALEMLSKAHIFIQHSVTSAHGDQEGFPVSIAEASALGIPVVSTAHSGITEGIIDGVTGFLVQEHDFEAMAEKILLLLESDDLRLRMGAAAAQHIRQVAPGFRREKSLVRIIRHGNI